ncbi:aldehyde dehydrogenase family protein, partial [Phyllobacterium sp. TAF24]|uniref:aldehyde dehydrogenase family protein n=1 Tax=Phyllobacterium sp. TAF24 TaxID=3233068 RepID=UPI003F94A4B0
MNHHNLPVELRDPSLIRASSYIGGTWIDCTATAASFAVINPSSGATITILPDLGTDHTRTAIDAAYIAQRTWAAMTGKERGHLLRQWFNHIIENADDLASILTAEMGKPLLEAKSEILYGASYVEWFAEEAKRIYGDTIPG